MLPKIRLLTTREVGLLFGVTRKTVDRWVWTGRLPAIRTPGGYYRFDPTTIRIILGEVGR